MSSQPPITVNQRALQGVFFSTLSAGQCRQLHSASLEILERTGVRLHSQAAIDLARKGGADIAEGNLARFPNGMVERAFTTAPRRIVLCDRHGRRVMPVEGHRCFYGPGSDTLNIIDHRDGARRKPTLQDVRDGVTLCDALPNIDFVMSMVLPTDVNTAVCDRHQMEAMLTYSAKPIVFVTYDMPGCTDAVEMAEAVAGGADALRRNPLIACYINVTTGLRHNAEAMDKLLFLAERGLPTTYIPVVLGGVTGPVTVAGEMALVNAGVLVGLVLSQLQREGAPYILPGWSGSIMDMHTMVGHYCDPLESVYTQALGHYYDLPMFSLAGASDSKCVDQQAAAEAAMSLLTNTLGGGNIIHDVVYLEAGLTFSLAQLALCDDLLSWIRHYAAPVEISDETLALDVIHEIGPDGQFLDHPHTTRHYKERFYPNLLDRSTFEVWEARGGKTLAERAAEKVTRILAEHQVEPLPADVAGRLRHIVQRAEARGR